MKVALVVVVYDRWTNLERWINCWNKCDKENTTFTVIHNDNGESDKFKELCVKNGVTYIKRRNVGFDIGAFQDVCKERLAGFDYDYDYLLWCTDDTIPLKADFIKQFTSKFSLGDIGCVCLEISNEVKQHIRTTGFCLPKFVIKKLTFLSDPIVNKIDCYSFEHRSNFTLLNQIQNLKLKVALVGNITTACMWNFGNRGNFNRWKEFEREFGSVNKGNKVTIIAPIYNTYPEIVSSMINQTHENWCLLLIHDGKNDTGLSRIINAIGDSRIKFIETAERKNTYGHPLRKWALENIDNLSPNTDYIVISNDDNYHAKTYLEELLKGFSKPDTKATYCSKFVHSYPSHQPDGVYKHGIIESKLQLGYIDCACVMMKKEIAVESGWPDMSHSSDFSYFSRVFKKYGEKSFNKVLGCLLVHA